MLGLGRPGAGLIVATSAPRLLGAELRHLSAEAVGAEVAMSVVRVRLAVRTSASRRSALRCSISAPSGLVLSSGSIYVIVFSRDLF